MTPKATIAEPTYHDAGIYAVISKKTGDMYIGSSGFLIRRLKTHVSHILRKGGTAPIKVWRGLKGHTRDDIELRVIERMKVEVRPGYAKSRLTLAAGYDDMLRRERYWIEKLQPSLNRKTVRPAVGVSIPILEGPPPMRIAKAS